MVINLEYHDIFNIVRDSSSFETGKILFESGCVTKLSEKEENRVVNFEMLVDEQNNMHVINIKFDKSGRYLGYVCSCNKNRIWKSGCNHLSAALFYLFEENQKTREFKIDKIISSELVEIYKDKIFSDVKKNMTEAFAEQKLIPRINIFNDELNIELSIFCEKKLVIKDIFTFLRDIKKGTNYSFIKSQNVKINYKAFDEKSKKLTKILMNYYDIVTARNSIFADIDQSKFLPLLPNMIDEFFRIYESESVKFSYNNDRETHEIEILNERPEFGISASYEIDLYRFTIENFPNRVFLGAKYSYFIMNEKLYRASLDFYRTSKPILNSFISRNLKELRFRGEDALNFEKIILPFLKDKNLISDIQNSSSPSKIRFYLDVEKNKISCRTFYFENGQEISLLEKDNFFCEFIINLLRKMGFLLKTDFVMELENESRIFDFFGYGVEKLKSYGEVLVSDKFQNQSYIEKSSEFNFDIRLSEDLLEIQFDSIDYSLDELFETLKNATANMKYYRLENGRYVNLANSGILKTMQLLDKFNISAKDISDNKIKLPKFNALYLDSLIKENNININIEDNLNNLIRDIKNYEAYDAVLPAQYEHVLRDYQKTGFKWLSTLEHYGFGGILSDEMGLGKTLQVISLLSDYIENVIENKKSIVICPTSLVFNWQKEIEKFAPELKVEVIIGTPGKRTEVLSNSNAHVLITTYDILKRDIKLYQKMEFKYLIADEAQYIKNPQTQNSKAIKLLKGEAKFALTGTPIENSLVELWSIFDFIMPGYLYNLKKFNKIFTKPIMKENENSEQLRNRIKPFILRRSKKEVLKELPDKIESNIYSEMTEDQKKIYSAFLFEARGEFDSIKKTGELNKSKLKILALITRLRQVCCDPSIIIQDYKGGSGKMEATLELLEQSIDSGHRILLFSQFTKMLEIIKSHLDNKEIPYFYLDGAVPSKTRLEMCENFNGGERDVFLISLKAGGTGLNLTGADVVIHFDPWWNTAVMNQATDRAHRIGQKKVVQVINVVSKDSIEEKILALQEKKTDMISNVLGEGESFVNKMSEQELEALFKI